MIRKASAIMIASVLLSSFSAQAAGGRELLRLDLEKHVKTFSREYNLYNYFNLNLGGYRMEETTLQFAQDRIKYGEGRLSLGGKAFRDFEKRSTRFVNAGPGLYLALDPFASSPAAAADTGANFGDSLIEIKFRTGTKYLPLMSAVSLSSETVQGLIAEGILTKESARTLLPNRKLSRDTFKFMVGYGMEAFRKLMADTLREMNVNLIEYAWQSGVSAICGWKDIRSAFVYIATDLPGDVSSVTMLPVGGYSSSIAMTFAEQELQMRSAKLHPLLKSLRTLEKKMKSTKGTKARSSIKQQANAMISASFGSVTELESFRDSTFKCK